MAKYYPQSQITPNLYTNGGEYITAYNKQNFEGFYYKTSDGNAYTGKNPNEGFNQLLLPNPQTPKNIPNSLPSSDLEINTIADQPLISEANASEGSGSIPFMDFDTTPYQIKFNPSPRSKFIPSYYYPSPTENDFKIGEFQRYCAKKTNEFLYIEISKEVYEKIVSKDPNYAIDLYEAISIPWLLVGDSSEIVKINFKVAQIVETNRGWAGFSDYMSSITFSNPIITTPTTPFLTTPQSSNQLQPTPTPTPTTNISSGGGGGY
jgi:hypothetical protein